MLRFCFCFLLLFLLGFCFVFFFFLVLWDRILLYSPNWPQTHDPPTSVSQVLGLQTYAQPAGFLYFLNDLVNTLLFLLRFLLQLYIFQYLGLNSGQTLYCLSHTSSPFCSGCFVDKVFLLFHPGWPGLWSYASSCSWNEAAHYHSFFLLRQVLTNFYLFFFLAWAGQEPWASWSQPPK
jgi:hypothetical protein